MMTSTKSLILCAVTLVLVGAGAGSGYAKDGKNKNEESKSLRTLRELRKLDAQDDSAESDEESDPNEKYQTRIETPFVGDYTNFTGLNEVEVFGYGLVVGLQNTGGNPAPSPMRSALMDDLKRRNVRKPNLILQSPDTALVMVRAKLPPIVTKGDTLDIDVVIPESAEATSLQGGWLMDLFLSEQAVIQGRGLTGHQYVRAKGPILTAVLPKDREKGSPKLMRGRVLGGGTVLRERQLSVNLRSDYRGVRNAIRISDAISRRFHDYDEHGLQKPMAKPKDDQRIALDVHPVYKNNFSRYLDVIRHVAFREQPTALRIRMQRLKVELQSPETSAEAALQLEAIGKDAIPVLTAGLDSPLLECRFHAACALSYLGESSGIPALKEAIRDERAFRVYALAAMSVIDDAEAHLALRELMKESSVETRYGSFRALWVLDKNDPFIRGEVVKVLDDKANYMLHSLDVPDEPLVHLTTRKHPEVVLFGADQSFNTPLYLTAGKNVMVTAQPGSNTASVVRFAPGLPDERREVSLKISDVIRAVSELDATYPDVVQMLTEAATQKNLPGRFAYDALPEGGRVYYRPTATNGLPTKGKNEKVQIGRKDSTADQFSSENSEGNATDEMDRNKTEETPSGDGHLLSVPAAPPGANNKPDDEKSSTRKKTTSTSKNPKTRPMPSREEKEPGPSRWPSWLTPKVHRFKPQTEEPVEMTSPSETATTQAETRRRSTKPSSSVEPKTIRESDDADKTTPTEKLPELDEQSEP